jgi:prepilin-type processing-associated H-X9-DG protein
MLLPALGSAKETARRIACMNNLKQLRIALSMYANDNDGQFPPRSSPYWPKRLWGEYENLRILICPTDSPEPDLANGSADDPDYAARSYLLNGFNDYFDETLSHTPTPPTPSSASPASSSSGGQSQWDLYMARKWAFGFPESAMVEPTDTIVFGEKLGPPPNFNRHLDALEGIVGQPIRLQVEESRHGNTAQNKGGGSNYAFGDGSVRFLKWHQWETPVNLWFVTEKRRKIPMALAP